MLVQHTLWLVERYLRQLTLLDTSDEVDVVLQMLGAVRGARRKAREIVEWLVMRDEISGAFFIVVNYLSLCSRILHAVLNGKVPGPGIPHP